MIARMRKIFLMSVAAMAFWPVFAAESELQPIIKRNPFERPANESLTTDAAETQENRIAIIEPELRGVLLAGEKSVVDFGGVILQIGESSDGYRLVSVQDGVAIFRKNGKKVSFSLRESNSSN